MLITTATPGRTGPASFEHLICPLLNDLDVFFIIFLFLYISVLLVQHVHVNMYNIILAAGERVLKI